MIASVLLGSHPPELPVASLVRVGDLFGIAEGTVRVALSRMAADGELTTQHGWYRLGPTFEARQAHQDRDRRPDLRPWGGGWEVVLVTGDDPVAGALGDLRLAAAGRRTWLRPANLVRRDDESWPPGTRRLEAAGDGDVAADRRLVASLWDLDGWAADGQELLGAFAAASDPAGRFVVAAAVLRHLRSDPLLPSVLVAEGWPDRDLREAYGTFTKEMADILASTTAT